jgi:peptidoglycan/xylan/chitin deacetylase (PgdA/CDA1 family)
MNFVRIPNALRAFYRDITWNIKDNKPTLYLTFDDGPTPDITPEVLSVLSAHQAQATFFSIGRNVERHPVVYKSLLQAGHATGNHTYSHLKGWFTPNEEYYADIALAAGLINSTLYRPAYGMITPGQLKYLKRMYTIVLWDTMSYDFAYNTSPEKCLRNVIRNAREGSVVVFHDSAKAADKVLYALPRVLDYFGEKGWEFRSITKPLAALNLTPGPSPEGEG